MSPVFIGDNDRMASESDSLEEELPIRERTATNSTRKFTAKPKSGKKAEKKTIAFVDIPKLRGRDLRKMLSLSGHTLVEFSTFMGRSKGWASECVVPLATLKTSMVEGLYTMLGHDQFWTVYTRSTGREVPAVTEIDDSNDE